MKQTFISIGRREMKIQSHLYSHKFPLASLKSPLTPLLQRGESLFQRGDFGEIFVDKKR